MANILNKMLDFVGWETEETEDDYYEDEEVIEADKKENRKSFGRKNQSKVLNLNSNTNTKVVIVFPKNINDAKDICDHLRANRSIVMNVEDVEIQTAQRIVDFLSGAVYSLDGNIQGIVGYFPCYAQQCGHFGRREGRAEGRGHFYLDEITEEADVTNLKCCNSTVFQDYRNTDIAAHNSFLASAEGEQVYDIYSCSYRTDSGTDQEYDCPVISRKKPYV